MADPEPKRRRMWEEEMLGEYTARHLPTARIVTRVRLGPPGGTQRDPSLTEEEARLLGASWRRWADAIAVEDGRLLVLEFAMIPDPRDVSLLLTYLSLVPATPELEEWRALPRTGRLVWAVDDPFSRRVATNAGLDVVIFRPSNWRDWLREKRARDTRGAVTLLPLEAAP